MPLTTKFNTISGVKRSNSGRVNNRPSTYLKCIRFKYFQVFILSLIGAGYYLASIVPIVKVCHQFNDTLSYLTSGGGGACECRECPECPAFQFTYIADHQVTKGKPWHPTNQFDVIFYDYIDSEFMHYAPPGKSCHESDSIWRVRLSPLSLYMLQSLIAHAITSINAHTYQERRGTQSFEGWNFYRFVNGYRSWDPSRGMDYIMDLQISKPWNKSIVETVRASYHQPSRPIIITRGPYDILSTVQKVNLTFVINIHPVSIKANLFAFLADLESIPFHKLSKVVAIFKLPVSALGPKMRITVESKLRQLGKVKRQWNVYITSDGKKSPNPLIFPKSNNYLSIKEEGPLVIIDTRYRFKQTFLDRCYANSEKRQTLYRPIPYAYYDTDIVLKYSSSASKFQPYDIDKQTGDWNYAYGMDTMCGYYKDLLQYYQKNRDKTKHHKLKVILGPDPGLIWNQTIGNCLTIVKEFPAYGNFNTSHCIERYSSFLGSKRQLAKYLLLQNYTSVKVNKIKH